MYTSYTAIRFSALYLLMLSLLIVSNISSVVGQDETATEEESSEKDTRPVRSTFESTVLIDNQSVMVPKKNSLEWDIQHRFGTVNNGYEDLIGIYAASNIRLGFAYTPIENLAVGFGFTKNNILWDFSAKYAIIQQARKKGMPIGITAYANFAIDTRKKENFENGTDRLSFFYQLILSRKINKLISVQVAPNMTHFNAIDENMKNDHFGLSFAGRVKLGPTSNSALIVEVDQPLTSHAKNNPHPNLSLGYQVTTSSHVFQVFLGNYNSLVNQYNNVFNINDYRDWDFLIGFNMTRNWNF